MAWVILVVSAMFEAMWASALDRMAEGTITLLNVISFVVGSIISVGGLYLALRDLPVGTSYAIWVGIGAATTVLWAAFAGVETLTALKLVFIGMIVAGVAGLKIVS